MLKNNIMKTFKELNEIMEKTRLSKLEEGLNAKAIRKKQGQWEGGKSNTGKKHSEETKKVWSERKIGSKRTADSVERSVEGLKQTWIEKMASIHSMDSIIKAQKLHGNHQANILDDLKITFNTYKKLLKHYGLEEKKKTNEEKTEWAKVNQSEAVLVWKEGKSGKPIGKPKTYYSVSECCRALSLPNKGRMLEKMSKGLPYHGYFFQKELK